MPFLIIIFCKKGIFSNCTSLDKSPRSINIESVTSKILSRFKTPFLLSIFEIILASSPTIALTSKTSLAELANDNAKSLILFSKPILNAAISFSDKAGKDTDGNKVTALLSPTRPPFKTNASALSSFTDNTDNKTESKSTVSILPDLSWVKTSLGHSPIRSELPIFFPEKRVIRCLSLKMVFSGINPVRTWAPSLSMHIGVSENCLIVLICCFSSSIDVCDILILK